MNWQSFISLIQQPSESSFFISSTRYKDQIGKTLCALLNSNGGILVVGYDKVNVHLTGYTESDEWINQFIDENFNKTLSITSAFLFRSNKKVLILEVLKAEQIVSYNDNYYQINNRNIELFEPQKTPAYNFNVTTPAVQKESHLLPSKPSKNNIPLTDLSAQKSENPKPFTIDQNSNLNNRQLKALDYVNQNKSIKNKDYRKLFSVSHKTAHIELAELVQLEKLKTSGSGRSTCYINFDSTESLENNEKNTDLDKFIANNEFFTESLYADEFNIDLAQAINELQKHCESGFLEKTIVNNEVCYLKSKQLSFI